MDDRLLQQLKKGVLEIICQEPTYGYELMTKLRVRSNDLFTLKEGTLYPILTRQKNAGLLTYRWEESPQGPPRKYYMLTEAGRQQLALLDEAWNEMVEQINIIRHGNPNAPQTEKPTNATVIELGAVVDK